MESLNFYDRLDDEIIKELAEYLQTSLYFYGAVIRSMQINNDSVTLMSACLLPSPFPKNLFNQALEIQKDFNELMIKVSYDKKFLHDCLKNTIESDEFTGNLWKIYTQIQQLETTQEVSLGLFRSDYMVNNRGNEYELAQVEFNTIASSFAGLSSKIKNCHELMLYKLNLNEFVKSLPENIGIPVLSQGLKVAFDYYNSKSAVIVFLVERTERNEFDQRALEYGVIQLDPTIKIVRAFWSDLKNDSRVTDDGKFYLGDKEVAVIYLRDGYSPHQYNEENWKIRFDMERSKAIKCPSVNLQLAGTKRVQQKLAEPGVLERFIKDTTVIENIRKTFVGLYSLDSDSNPEAIVEKAIAFPDKYVLKPQREGGGNNFYGNDLIDQLKKLSPKEREAYILMERIFPPTFNNCLVRLNTVPQWTKMISELGVFGSILGNGSTILHNNHGGHLLRTKAVDVDEGGVATGYSGIDSPLLIE